MRPAIPFVLCASLLAADRKLTFEERVEILRGLTAEYATVKTLLPRSKKALPMDSNGSWDKRAWEDSHREHGPAARKGDLVQITKVEIDSDKITFEINGGFKSGRKWYERVEVGTGTRTSPIGQGGNPTLGTTLELRFARNAPPSDSAEVKKMLAPLFDFERRSATEQYVESLPPAVQEAIKNNQVIEGMTKEQVVLAAGKPVRKLRETKDGLELEEWIYGQPPGKITFVTFHNDKVTRVKNAYAGLGGAVADPNAPPVR
jgi:hypothetical protein